MSRYLFGAVAALALVLVFTDAVDAQQRGRARGRGNRGANVVQRQRVVNRGRPAVRQQRAVRRGGQQVVVNRQFNRTFVRSRRVGFGKVISSFFFPQQTVVVDAFGNVIAVARAPGLFGF